VPFDRVAITRVSTTQERPDDIFLDLEAADTGHSRLIAKGYFTGIYGPTSEPGIDLRARIDDAGDALGAVAAGKKIEGLSVSGRGASVRLQLTEPFAKLKVAGAFRGIDVQFTDYRAERIGFDLVFDAGAAQVDVKRFQLEAPAGGRLDLDARLRTDTLKLDLDLRLRDLATAGYLPPGRARDRRRQAGRQARRARRPGRQVGPDQGARLPAGARTRARLAGGRARAWRRAHLAGARRHLGPGRRGAGRDRHRQR